MCVGRGEGERMIKIEDRRKTEGHSPYRKSWEDTWETLNCIKPPTEGQTETNKIKKGCERDRERGRG